MTLKFWVYVSELNLKTPFVFLINIIIFLTVAEFDRAPSMAPSYPVRKVSRPRTDTSFQSSARFVPSFRNQALPKNNRRMGGVLNPMAPIFEDPRYYHLGNILLDLEEADQMRRMTPQGEFQGRDAPPSAHGETLRG
jgi:hypothetical protein